jgi:hypothetical protein
MEFGDVGFADPAEGRRAGDSVATVDEEAADLADRLERRYVALQEDAVDRATRQRDVVTE